MYTIDLKYLENKSIYFILRNVLTHDEISKLIEEYNEPNSNVYQKIANVFFEASLACVVVFKNVVLTNENIQQFEMIEKIQICGGGDEYSKYHIYDYTTTNDTM